MAHHIIHTRGESLSYNDSPVLGPLLGCPLPILESFKDAIRQLHYVLNFFRHELVLVVRWLFVENLASVSKE